MGRARFWSGWLLLMLLGACGNTPLSYSPPQASVDPPSVQDTPAVGTEQLQQQTGTSVDWPVFDHDPQRSGVNAGDTAITPATVGSLQRLWMQSLPEKADGSPVLLSGLSMPDGSTADLLYVTTSHGTTLALNAQDGTVVWQQASAGPMMPTEPCQICATPAADPSRQWIYAAGMDGAVHRYAATTGEEDQAPPWPVPVTLMNGSEKRSSALNVANGYLYVAMASYNDRGPYVGHIVAVHLVDGAVHVFNALCSDQHQLLASPSVVPSSAAVCDQREAGVWARSGVVVDQSGGPTDGSLFIASGNGLFDADQGGVDYGDSVMRLSADASALLDSYTPTNYARLDEDDLDLGSVAPVLLPPQTQSNTPYLLVQGGKDGAIRLLDRTHLGGVGGELQRFNLTAGQMFAAPIAWQDPQASDPSGNTWVFVSTESEFFGFRVITDASGQTTLGEPWHIQGGGTSPIVAGGVLFIATQGGVLGLDPNTGKTLWISGQGSAAGNIGPVHWQSPIVVSGRLYIADENGQLSAYGLAGP